MVSAMSHLNDILEGTVGHLFWNAASMIHVRYLVNEKKPGSGILDVFHLAQSKQCTEKVDCLLSLIGILRQEYEAVSVAAGIFDYHQPYWAVVLRFVRSVLQIDLEPLSLAGACRSRNLGLPSWCPDFTSRFSYMYSQRPEYRTTPRTPVIDTYSTDQVLRCRGFKLGTVFDKADGGKLPLVPPAKGCDTGDRSKDVVLWERECYDLAQRTNSSNKAILDDQFPRVLILGENELRAYPEYQHRPEPINEIHSLWLQSHWRNASTGAPMPSNWDAVRRYGKLVRLNGYRSNFFATLEGQLGSCESDIQPNDVLYILYGGRSPFVLRPSKHDNTMRLVGDAYIEGVMYGEALTADNKQPDEWVNLV